MSSTLLFPLPAVASPSISPNSPKQLFFLKNNLSLLECLSKAPKDNYLLFLSTFNTLLIYFLVLKETDPETWTCTFHKYESKSVKSISLSNTIFL